MTTIVIAHARFPFSLACVVVTIGFAATFYQCFCPNITSTAFGAHHNETGDTTALGYDAAEDQAQGTAFQFISNTLGNDADQNMNGTLHLFAPSSTTFVKHFMAESNVAQNSDFTIHRFHAGYINTTSAITEIQFKMSSGNIDSGVIKLYGVA